jgi:hypothetical protein
MSDGVLPVRVTNESNSANTSSCCTVLYFERPVTPDELKEGLRYVAKHRSRFPQTQLVVDPDDGFFTFKERSTPVSERAGLSRYECCGSC